jgi:hypothetical protein
LVPASPVFSTDDLRIFELSLSIPVAVIICLLYFVVLGLWHPCRPTRHPRGILIFLVMYANMVCMVLFGVWFSERLNRYATDHKAGAMDMQEELLNNLFSLSLVCGIHIGAQPFLGFWLFAETPNWQYQQ